ncbi:MAG: hypothetical protein OIF58_14885 [Cohaesibacter sp.]|nr:hypothetical protein [Cohaesibacter sp.]
MAYLMELAYHAREPHFEFLDKPENKYGFSFSLGLPANPARLPTKAIEETRKKSYPDIFTMPALNAVSQRFKDLVEDFEPEVHQFFPLELFRKNGDPVEEDFYIFNCTVTFDSLLMKHSDEEWLKLDEPDEYPRLRITDQHKQTLSRPAIGGRHIWKPFRQRITGGGLYVSDAFHKRLKQEKFKYFLSAFCPEVDELWIAEENVAPLLNYEAKHGLQPGMMPWLKANSDK